MTVSNPLANGPQRPPKPSTPWYKRWWVWVLAGFIVLFVLPLVVIGSIGAALEDSAAPASPSATEPAEETDAAETETPDEPAVDEVTEEPTETETETPTADPSDLAADVEAAVLASNGVSAFSELGTSSPGYAITGIEEITSSTIRVQVQQQLTDAERDDTARWVFNMSCDAVPALGTVVITDISGIDHNWYADRNVTMCS
ncbi:hypothetical protein [Agrococcus casei]|uniref:hypothetical protein n=1 Tax=Agrococcus casei TaxID=343512 RepID=UPI0011786531|nr:hypothetical protein [Agrococcus casei]